MKDSALNDPREIQRSFSQYLCDKEKVDDVLLVEGKTDYTFYRRFTSEKEYKIYYDTPPDNNNEDEGKKKHKPTVKSLVEKMSLEGKNIYGIIDPDYKDTFDIDDRIHVIDANSLETLILKYSDKAHNVAKAISNFDKLFRKGKFKDDNMTFKYSKIADDVLKWAFFIGRIRKLSDLCNYRLDFRKVKEKSNFYRNYIKTSPKNNDKKEFNQEEYLKDLFDKSLFSPNVADDFSSFSNKIKKNIEEYIEEYNEKSVWNICQGHDIFDFIECLNPNSKPSRSTVLSWEYDLLEVFDIKNFQDSPLQKWFDKINRKTTGYWKNR